MVLTAIEAVFIKKIILYSSTTISFIVWCWFGAIFSFALLFAFKVHLVKVLLPGFSLADNSRKLQNAVSQGGLAVINVRNNGKVSDLGLFCHRVNPP